MAPVTGERVKEFMKKKTVDPDMPIGKLEELAKAPTIVTMTIGLDAKTIAFFKRQAKKRGAKYQKMIREVLARYANHYSKAA